MKKDLLPHLIGQNVEVAHVAFRRYQENACILLIDLLYGYVKEEIADEAADPATANKSVLENPMYR